MSKPKPEIVFFTPSMQRTGSELVLFNLLPFIKDDFRVTLVSMYKGPLYDELPAGVQKDYLYRSVAVGPFARIMKRLRTALIVPGKLEKYAKGTWYINTIVLPQILEFAERKGIPAVVHLHELKQMYALLSAAQLSRLVDYPFLHIANSKITADTIAGFGRKKDTEICYPAIDTSAVGIEPAMRKTYRQKLGLRDDEFVWAMCGTIDENKNPFLFTDLASELKKSSRLPFRMVWIGAVPEGTEDFFGKVKTYVQEKGVAEQILWVTDAKKDFHAHFMVADGFVLTSRFESFSLVTLEAMLLGLPVVANNCGGVKEVLGNVSGYVSEEKDNVGELSAKMLEYMKNPVDEKERAAQVKAAHSFDISIWGEKWRNVLKNKIIG